MTTTLQLPVQLAELESLPASRQAALQRLSQLSYPTQRQETWRRTDPEALQPHGLPLIQPKTTFSLLDQAPVPAGWALGSIDKVAERINTVLPLERCGLFPALNAAAYQGGCSLVVGADQSTREQALLVHHHYDKSGLAVPRSYLEIGAGSSVTLVEFFTSEQDLLAAPTVEIRVGPGAKFRYVFVNLWSPASRVVPTVHAQVDKDAHFQMLFAGLGTRVTKACFESDLVGTGSKSEVLGLILGQGRQHYDIDAQQNHRVGKTVSDVLCHVALTERARSIFAGNILCEPGAQQIDGYQQNRNLLLSDKARADSMPRLEIEANDVRCTHGASFSTYDAEQRFYLQSRGMTAFEAEHLLVTGFFAAVIERLEHEELAQWLSQLLEAKMQQALGSR